MNQKSNDQDQGFEKEQRGYDFNISVQEIQELFLTESIDSGKSEEIIQSKGGIHIFSQQLFTNIKDGIDCENQALTNKRIEIYGDNTVQPPALTSYVTFMYKQTEDFCVRILALASLLIFFVAFVSEDPFESLIQSFSIAVEILAVILIGASTDYNKEKQFIELYMEQERDDVKYFTIIRNGQRQKFNQNKILVGDIVEILPGDQLTFDGILLRGSSFVEVDESMITGLTDCLKKRPCMNVNDNQIISTNECFMRGGSNIFEGYGTVLVCAVGENTFLNFQKNQEVKNNHQEEKELKTPLQNSTTVLAKNLVFIGCVSATFMFIVLQLYMIREIHELKEKFFSLITLQEIFNDIVSAFLIIVLSIPEGLPLIVTLSTAFSISQMKEKGIVVRNLHTCQILGSVNVICFDKTGTLTQNNICTRYIYLDGFSNEVNHHKSIGEYSPLMRILAECIITTNTSQIKQDDELKTMKNDQLEIQTQDQNQNENEKVVIRTGNRIDVALMSFLDQNFGNTLIKEYGNSVIQKVHKVINQIDGRNNYSAAYIEINSHRNRIYIKGKPLDILIKCNKVGVKQIRDNDDYRPINLYEIGDEYVPQQIEFEQLDDDRYELINSQINAYAENSLKCSGFAYKDIIVNEFSDVQNDLLDAKDFTFIGLVGLRDDLRDDALQTIQVLQEACIDIKMITGDTRLTAVNVAKSLTLISNELANSEKQRVSEILLESSVQSQVHSQKNQLINSKNDENNPLIQSSNSDGIGERVNPFLKKINENIQSTIRINPLVLNFQEYLIKIRQILKASEKFYEHTIITDANCLSLIKEIREDKEALQQIQKLNKNISLIADASQYQKQQFLQMLIEINQCTMAYTGDGNNDVRSLRTAQIGVAPGNSATNVAKECSGIILMNDKLSGIGPSLGWGRNIFLNIKRFIYFQLAFYITSVLVMIVSSIVLDQQPFSFLQVIWLALVQDTVPAISLSTEIPQTTIFAITRPFRPEQNLIDIYLYKLIIGQCIYQCSATIIMLFFSPAIFNIEPSWSYYIYDVGSEFQPEWAVHFTMIFYLTCLFQMINLINARRIGPYEYNPLEGILQNRLFIFLITILFIRSDYFKTAPLTFIENFSCILIAFGSVITYWFCKYHFSESYFDNFEKSSTQEQSKHYQ